MVVSHGGVKGTCDNARTLCDAHVRAIAATGGVIGIGYWQEAVCGTAPHDVARAIHYAVELVGDEHVALGSDYDGGTTVGFDTSQIAVLTQAMLDEGVARESIPKILGGNAARVLAATLPRSLRGIEAPLNAALVVAPCGNSISSIGVPSGSARKNIRTPPTSIGFCSGRRPRATQAS